MRNYTEQTTEDELLDTVWQMITRLQAMTDRLLLQQEKTERRCFLTTANADAYSLSALNG